MKGGERRVDSFLNLQLSFLLYSVRKSDEESCDSNAFELSNKEDP